MDEICITEYTGNISHNINDKFGYLSEARPEIAELILEATNSSNGKPKNKKRVVEESPSWLRVRPTRKSRKCDDGDSDYEPDSDCSDSPVRKTIRRSKNDSSFGEYFENVERRLGLTKRPNQYGAIKGVVIGQWWKTRLECSYSGAHRPTVAGIHAGPDGAYSVALSGGYEGDWDLGDEFTYTGEGGRDLKGTKANPKNLRTAPQSKDQVLSKGNLALHKSMENDIPVRVIRGYKLQSVYSPEEGYRYDGLYRVIKCWSCIGQSGFLIYKFHFVRIDNQHPLIDSMDDMLMYNTLKIYTPNRSLQRKKRSRNSTIGSQSGDLTEESSDEGSDYDEEGENEQSQSTTKKNGLEDKEECNDYVNNTQDDSECAFYNGRFLGWSNPMQDHEGIVELFRNLVKKMTVDDNEVVHKNVEEEHLLNDEPSSDVDSSFDNEPSSDVNSSFDNEPSSNGDVRPTRLKSSLKDSRRKSQTPRKIVRFSV